MSEAIVLALPTDERSDRENKEQESEDHDRADEQVSENNSRGVVDGHGGYQSSGWPPRFTAS